MLDFFSDHTRRNPFPAYDAIRGRSPVVHDPRSDAWMVFDYAGVKRVLTDHEVFSSSVTPAPLISKWLIFSDTPRHTKLRRLVSKAFTPGMIAGLEPRIRELSRELLDQVIERGEMDMAAEFSGSEQESDGTLTGVHFVAGRVSVDWRVETRRLDQDTGLAGVHGLPAGN
jgi:cytochrome P450